METDFLVPMKKLSIIKWDVVGLSEVKRLNVHGIVLESSHA